MFQSFSRFLLILLLLVPQITRAQTKHALILFVSTYPQDPAKHKNWRTLHSDQDRIIVRDMLASQMFKDEHILELVNEGVTASNVRSSFEKLIEQIEPGDIVYVHYSGHGQQTEDTNGDEADGYDEALALFHAPSEWHEGYDYREHFVDDELNAFLERIRKKLGSKGQVVVVLDSCHAGSASRGDKNTLVRRGSGSPCAPKEYINKQVGAAIQTDQLLASPKSPEMASLTCYFSCQSYEANYEYPYQPSKYCGSLTYFLATSMKTIGSQSTHRNLYAKIQESYVTKHQNIQHPSMESDDLNALIFNGKIIVQEPYITVQNLLQYTAKINAGAVQGLHKGDTVGFYPNTAANHSDTPPLFKGIVVGLNATVADINILGKPKEKVGSASAYRVFLIGTVPSPTQISIQIAVKDKKLKQFLTNELGKLPFVTITEGLSDFTLLQADAASKEVQIIVTTTKLINSSVTIHPATKEGAPELIDNLHRLNRIKSFMNLAIDDPSVSLMVRLKSEKSTFKQEEKDSLIFQNLGVDKLFLYLINIDPDYRIRSARSDQTDVSEAAILAPNIKKGFNPTFSCSGKEGNAAPCGTTVTKIIASSVKLEGLDQIYNLNTNSYSAKRGLTNELLPYFQLHLEGKTRSGNTSTPKIDVINWIYSVSP